MFRTEYEANVAGFSARASGKIYHRPARRAFPFTPAVTAVIVCFLGWIHSL